MYKVLKFGLPFVVVGLVGTGFAIGFLNPDNPSAASAAEESPEQEVWVGIERYVSPTEVDYLVGTISLHTFEQIELDKYDRRFLRLSNLRVEESLDDDGDSGTYYNCEDRYDWPIILVKYADICSIQLKKGDPLRR